MTIDLREIIEIIINSHPISYDIFSSFQNFIDIGKKVNIILAK